MIEVVKQEVSYSKMVDEESEKRKAALIASTEHILNKTERKNKMDH